MNHGDHAKKHGRHDGMIMARSCHGGHVFPTRDVFDYSFKIFKLRLQVLQVSKFIEIIQVALKNGIKFASLGQIKSMQIFA